MEEQKEIRKYFREQQEKYTYYIIALCVAAIGFSVNQTFGMPLKWSYIPLGLAIVLWSGSIYCGINFIKFVISSLYNNHEFLNVAKEYQDDAAKLKFANKTFAEIAKADETKYSSLSKWQYRLFIWGFLSFLVWHVLEMYIKSLGCCCHS